MPKRVLDERQTKKVYRMLQEKKLRQSEIAEQMGVSGKVIAYYNGKLKKDKALRDETKREAIREKVKEMMEDDATIPEIRKATGLPKRRIFEIVEELNLQEQYDREAMRKRLDRDWKWKTRKQRLRKNPVTGCRIVYKGERSNFRTPYRPDGIWR